jgi:hypothetical protein
MAHDSTWLQQGQAPDFVRKRVVLCGLLAAKGVVQETLDLYQALRDRLDPDERSKLERSMGLKMEQLKVGYSWQPPNW